MTIVYTALEHDKLYHGRGLLDIIQKGMPKGGFATTSPIQAEYYTKRYKGNWAILALDIPNIEKYTRITDKHNWETSYMFTKTPPTFTFIKIGQIARDFMDAPTRLSKINIKPKVKVNIGNKRFKV